VLREVRLRPGLDLQDAVLGLLGPLGPDRDGEARGELLVPLPRIDLRLVEDDLGPLRLVGAGPPRSVVSEAFAPFCPRAGQAAPGPRTRRTASRRTEIFVRAGMVISPAGILEPLRELPVGLDRRESAEP